MAEPILSVVVPAYQSADRITVTIQKLLEYLMPRGPFEIILIDDGSQDGTADRILEQVRVHPEISLIRFAGNQGKGAAVRAGMLAARGRWICFCDADLPIPIGQLDRLRARLEDGCDVAIASRTLPESSEIRQDAIRRLLSRTFNRLVRLVFGLPFGDTQCGFKGFRRAAAQAIFSRAQLNGFAFDVEVLLLARQLGFRVGQIPVHVEHSALSTVRLSTHAWEILRDLWTLRRNLQRHVYGLAQRPDQAINERVSDASALAVANPTIGKAHG